MWKKVAIVLGVVVVLIVIGIAILIGKKIVAAGFSPGSSTQQQIDAKLLEGFTKAAEQANARGPVMVDAETRWEKSVAGPGPRLTYFYTLPKYSSRDVDRSWFLEKVKPQVRNGVCASPEIKPSLQYGGTYVYAYAGNDGIEIARFELSKRDCGF